MDSLIITQPDKRHILLLDIGLPGISGIEAIPLILGKVPDINIVMLTTCGEEEAIVKSLCAGACSYILKGPRERNCRSFMHRCRPI